MRTMKISKGRPDYSDPALEKEKDITEQGFRSFNGNVLIRHHRVPRSTLFVPTDPESAFPTKYLDVMRTTYTNLDTKADKKVEDYWDKDGNKLFQIPE